MRYTPLEKGVRVDTPPVYAPSIYPVPVGRVSLMPLFLCRHPLHHPFNMRLTSLLSLGPLAITLGVQAQQQPLQIYLHPTPANIDSAVPTLSADQAKAVLAHHLGGNIGDFDEIPNDEGLWGHLMGMWNDKNEGGVERKARVVIIDGGVEAQGKLI